VSDYQAYIDGLILEALRKDDEQPLSHLFHFYYNRLLRAGLRWCANAPLTEECIQEVFFDLWHYRHQLGAIASLEAYLKTALRRRIFKKLSRPDPLGTTYGIDSEVDLPTAMTVESYEQILIEQQSDEQQRKRLEQALTSLTTRQKEMIHLRYFEEIPYKDIAERFDIPVGAVYKQVHDAIKRLREVLGEAK
jgi:RNA polymerase sigma factor (sigma-70 family)